MDDFRKLARLRAQLLEPGPGSGGGGGSGFDVSKSGGIYSVLSTHTVENTH